MLLTLTNTWMHMHRCDWRIMVLTRSLHCTSISNIALIDVKVFRAHIEVFLLSLCKVQTVCVDLLTVLPASNRALGLLRRGSRISWVFGYAQEVERLRVDEHSWPPIAHFSVITDTHDRVLVMISDD